MHYVKRLLTFVVLLLVFGTFSVFANGQGEATNLTGTVSSITPTGTGNTVNVVLTTKSGSYTVTVDQSLINTAGLQVGKTVSLKGVVHRATDGAKQLDASEVEVDGKSYSVSQQPTAEGVGSSAASGKAKSPDPQGSPPEVSQTEKPETHSGDLNSPSKDTQKPEVNHHSKGSGKDD